MWPGEPWLGDNKQIYRVGLGIGVGVKKGREGRGQRLGGLFPGRSGLHTGSGQSPWEEMRPGRGRGNGEAEGPSGEVGRGGGLLAGCTVGPCVRPTSPSLPMGQAPPSSCFYLQASLCLSFFGSRRPLGAKGPAHWGKYLIVRDTFSNGKVPGAGAGGRQVVAPPTPSPLAPSSHPASCPALSRVGGGVPCPPPLSRGTP